MNIDEVESAISDHIIEAMEAMTTGMIDAIENGEAFGDGFDRSEANFLLRAFGINLKFIKDSGFTLTYAPTEDGYAWRIHASTAPVEGSGDDEGSSEEAEG